MNEYLLILHAYFYFMLISKTKNFCDIIDKKGTSTPRTKAKLHTLHQKGEAAYLHQIGCGACPKFFLIPATVTPVEPRCVAIRSSVVHVLDKKNIRDYLLQLLVLCLAWHEKLMHKTSRLILAPELGEHRREHRGDYLFY